jgi:hypothetical protein
MATIPTLDTVHQTLSTLARKALPDGRPAFLFRGERVDYPTTLSSIDRHYHNCDPDVHDELDDVTAFAMVSPLKSKRLPPKLAGAFAQHYGLPTQVFDFTASPNVAISFASNRKYHDDRSRIGRIGVLDVSKAERVCAVYDLRQFPEALRARRQHAFGMIYGAFRADDFVNLKNHEIATQIGLQWTTFAHLPDDESYLYLVGAEEDLVSTVGDEFADVAQEMVDRFVSERGPLSKKAAAILSREVPHEKGRTKGENLALWTGHKIRRRDN